jgi:hypothetical protein
VMGTVNCPRTLSEAVYCRGVTQDDRLAGWFTVTMGTVRRQDTRDRGLEVIAVEIGAGREAFLPVMHARPSRVAK